MKKIFLYLISALVVFSSCQKDEDPVFDQSPDKRLKEALARYQAALLSSPNGWKAAIVPENGALYNFFFRFDDKNRVKMFSDWDTSTAARAMESSYRLKALQQPSLVFDTYSYIHLLADPSPEVNGIFPGGQGFKTDFEFVIDSVTSTQVLLTGRFNGTKMTLTKATAQEATAWEAGQWARSLSLLNIDKIPVYFKRLVVGGQQLDVQIDAFSRTISIFYTDASGTARVFTTSFAFSAAGIQFARPFTNGAVTFSGFSNISWNEATSVVSLSVNGTPTTISGATSPAAVDRTAPQKWRQAAASQGAYFAALGFTVNGVFDALRVTSIADYIVYWPQLQIGGANVDLLGYVTSASINYGSTFSAPTFTPDGRALFTHLRNIGTVPPAAAGVVASMVTQMTEPAGYYLVQTSATTWDMVSAKDARSWITWFLV